MSSKDYLTRYFQQLGQVLSAIMGYREQGKHQLALNEIDQILEAWFNVSADQIEKSSSEELIEQIDDHSEKNIDKIKSVAELLYQKVVTLYELDKKDNAFLIAPKALAFFRFVDMQSQSFSIEIQERIAELDHMLNKAKNS